jgi:hypothetical protein
VNAPAPLLWRQLALEASHGRTFWVRPLFGVVVACCLLLASGLAGTRLLSGQGLESGSGRALFDALMLAGFAAVYLGLPALIAPAVAAEEERGTLDLLRIAGIGPLALIGQLAGARLVMAGTVALAAAPLAALAYACGGVSDQRLLAAGVVLAVAGMQVAACAAAVGARRLPSTRAALAAYREVVLHLLLILPICCGLLSLALMWTPLKFYGLSWSWYRALADATADPWTLVGGLIPAAISIVWYLRLAERRMRRRAVELPPAQSFLMNRWRSGPRWQREVRRWRLQHNLDRGELPQDDPLAWRARLYAPLFGSRLKLARLRTFGCLLPIVGLIVLLNTVTVLGGRQGGERMIGVQIMADVILALALAASAYAAATALPRERANGSLGVLATTPLSGTEVADGLGAAAGELLRRALPAYLILLLFCALIEWRLEAWAALLGAAAVAMGLCGTARWGGLLLGARSGQPLAAGSLALAACLGVLLGPWLAGRAALAAGWEDAAVQLTLFSPWHLAAALHGGNSGPAEAILVVAICWLIAWAALRWTCRRRMDRWLGRAA